jgi:hypothetical protein
MTAMLAAYEARRAATPTTVQGQWELAEWCEQQGLRPEATAHWTEVTRLAPQRSEAWHRLGCQSYHGRWLNPEQLAAERAEDQAQNQADHHWQPILEKWKKELVAYSPLRERAVSTLARITDPRAVPSIRRVLGHGSADQQALAVAILGPIDCPSSSHALAALALYGRSPEVHAAAIQVLKRRDPRDFVDALIGLLRRPLAYEVRPVGPHDEPRILVVEGSQTRARRIYKVPQVVAPNPFGPGYIAAEPATGRTKLIGPNPLLQFLRESPMKQLRDLAAYDQQAAQCMWRAHLGTQQVLERDVRAIQRTNTRREWSNVMVASILTEITGERLGPDPDAWNTWWNDRIGYRYERIETPIKRTSTTQVPIPVKLYLFRSCFAAGTPVWTLTGPQPIESLHIGDLVLSQDTATGALGYEPVVEMHYNPPDATLRIRLQGDTLEPTTYHRFWRPGRGWVMARDLQPGDLIRTAGGRTEVLAVEHGPTQPVFNLDVARNCTFFVGLQKELVHDNSLPPPVLTPFDAEPSLASIGRGLE